MSSEPEIIYTSKYMMVTRYKNLERSKTAPPTQETIQTAIEKNDGRIYRFSVCEMLDKKYNMLIKYGILAEEWIYNEWVETACLANVTNSLIFAEELARRCNEKHIFPNKMKDELRNLKCEEMLFGL